MNQTALSEEPQVEPPRAPFSRFGGWLAGQFAPIRARLISGLLVAAPIVITGWIVYWLFVTLARFILDPLAMLVKGVHNWLREAPALQDAGIPDSDWWYTIASPILAILLVLATLYILGLAVRSWVYRMVDWMILQAPVVATIYRAVRNLVDSLGGRLQGKVDPRRVVLVEFPHPGIRSLGLVTNSIRDEATGQKILVVCMLMGVMPPTGFTLFVPEENVTNVDWSVNEALQTIVSGGISAPPSIPFTKRSRLADGKK